MGLHERLVIAQIQRPRVFKVEVSPSVYESEDSFSQVVNRLEESAIEVEKQGGKLFFSEGNVFFFEHDIDLGIGEEVEPSLLEAELEKTRATVSDNPLTWADTEEEALKMIEISLEDFELLKSIAEGGEANDSVKVEFLTSNGLLSNGRLTDLGRQVVDVGA